MFASNFRVRTHSIFLTVAMLAALLFAPPSAIAADPVPGADFTLTILHNNDGESQLINAGSGLEDFGGIARFKTLVDGLRADAVANGNGVLMLSSGDNFLAGPEFNASIENGIPYYDALGIEAIGYDAISLGNHDFDFGPDTLADFLSSYSSAPQYLNANLDFSGEPGLQAFVDSGVIAPSTVVSTGGEDIGIVGAITPSLRSISSPRGVVIDFDVAGAIQAEIDTLTAAGVNKIVIISHLQSIDEDIALAAQLTGVDVMIAGGGDELLANPGDPLVPGEEDDVFGAYPLTATGGDGASIPIVTTPGEYKYLGQLSVGFDSDGNVVGVGTDSGPKVVDGTLTPDAGVQAAVVDPVVAALATLDSTVIGTSEVTLDGTRATVRSVESNEGNLIADALWWQATELAADFGVNPPDVALQNGGGIRNNVTIPAGDITLLDTFDSVPFSNFVSIVPDIPRWKFRNILENAVSNVPGDGRFAQVSGFSFTYDARGIPMNIDDETGEITQLGTRIVDVTLDDGTEIVKDGAVIPGDRINIATIDFLARGGDQYPYVGAPFTSVGVSYQQAMANYIVDGLNGLITAADYPEGGEGRITAIAGMVDGPFTPIYDVQGDGDASPLDGEVVEIEGTVTGVFPDLGGFYLQETVGDGDAATSDGVFVESDEAVAAGTHAAVLGVVEENFGETRVAASAVDTVANGAALAPTEVTLPLADGASLEAYEGMLITFPEYLFVSDMFNLHRFGEALLSAGGVLVNPTDVAEPGDAANAVAAANSARSIILDDGSGAQFPDTVPYTVDGQRRRGDAAKDITANLSFSFGAYKLQPTEDVTFVEMNPRPDGPDDVGGNLKVASFNVLNFFSTIDDGDNGARGADSDAEKAAQLTKLVAAINGLGADIIGLQEIENNGPVAIGELVDALNAEYGEGTWAAAADPEYPGGLETTNAIKVGIIFKTASVTPVGTTEVSEDPVFAADRPPIAHSFEAFGDTFTVINNHFKSKSSRDAEGADLDQGDGQGAYNARRTAQAGALVEFTLERVAATQDGDVLVIGDFNSYSNEDPIALLEGAGFLTNLVKENLTQEDSYSLVFFGQQGLLDGAFATSTLDPKVTGIDIWHINADETRVLQYNDDVVDPAERSSDFNQPVSQPDEFSSSDHDPIIVGLQLGGAETVATGLFGPRHIGMGPEGTVYVAESGVGGAEPCIIGGAGDEECFGLTGAVTAISNGSQSRIVTGLPSVAAEGFAAIGPSDVAVAADGTVRALIGLGQDPAVRDEVLAPAGGELFGYIANINADGTTTGALDVAAYEAANNPDGLQVDSNPNALIHFDGGYLIADAGGNSLLKFDGTELSTVAVFPPRLVPAPPFIPDPEIPMDAVPTSVTIGPDGYAYVGQLTGFPFPVGGANVYKVDPATGDMSVFADGFTNIVDLEFGPDGSLYVVQISSSGLLFDELDGAVIRVSPDGSREVFYDALFAPTGIAVDQTSGDVYVSNCGICPGFGEVIRIDGEPASPISLGYSATNDRSAPSALDGATVSGKIYPFVEPLDPGLGFTTVDFYLDGEHARTEYLAPYDFAGGLLTMATAFDTSSVADGEHTIKASGNLPDGSTIETSATFTVDNAPMAAEFGLAVSDNAFRTNAFPLDGATVFGDVYAFVDPLFPDGYESFDTVSFYLDGVHFHTEYAAPYDFVSGGIEQANERWDTTTVADGEHTITAKANRRGQKPLVAEATFTVANDAPDVFDVAIADGRFTTLVAATRAAGLEEGARGLAPYTVFAPTDDAFAALPDGVLEGLLADPEALAGVVLYHILPAPLDSTTLAGLSSVTSVTGQDITIEVVNGDIILNGSVKVIEADLRGRNGIAHVIDAVLSPPVEPIRFATFNASLNRSNAGDLVADLSTPDNAQAKVIAETIQRTRPEVLLLNEFDFDVDGEGARLFQENYLSVSQNGAAPIVYDYAFSAPSNTGVASGLDLDNSGDVGGPNDAFGFGFFEGQFGMQVYSQYPIDFANVRTFQNFLWADMPGALLPFDPVSFSPWYSEEELAAVRLSSKSHWDVPIMIGEDTVNFLVSHPTPPVFDGPEDRNGTRNYDEIRFWKDYVNGADYIYDDAGARGGWTGDYFVIAGDQNSDPFDGDSQPGAAQLLLDDARVNTSVTPSSLGAVEQNGLQGGANLAHLGDPAFDTADFNDNPAPGNLRADYVLPSVNLDIVDSGVFWPESTDPLFPLVGTFPFPGSDHRLVWVDLLPGATALPPPVEPPMPMTFTVTVENLTDGQPFTPLGVTVHDPSFDLFEVGEAANLGIQELAENGNLSAIAAIIQASRSLQSGGYAGSAPLVPAADPGSTGFASSDTFQVTGLPGHVISLGFMLICTNDGFSGLDSVALPAEGETLVIEANAYDAGTEINTEDFADMVPPCQGLIGVSSEDEGTGATNPDLAEGGVIGPHAGIVGGVDLDPAVHGWTDPVARITIVKGSPLPDLEETLAADGRFTTLVDALGVLGDPPPNETFTLLAPTDEAFDALPPDLLEALLDDRFFLTDVLLNHVIPGTVPAETIVTLTEARTLLGAPLTIEVVDGTVILNGAVQVIETDIFASNGVIHVIDGVLLPPPPPEPLGFLASVFGRGSTEVPGPGDSAALTSAFIDVFEGPGETAEVCFFVNTSVQDPTVAHIHRGGAGEAGPVVVDTGFSADSWTQDQFAPLDRFADGCVDVERELALEIIGNPAGFYFNLHSGSYPGGATREQLVDADGVETIQRAYTAAPMLGVNEVPGPGDPDSGRGFVDLLAPATDNGEWCYSSTVFRVGVITSGHIHIGAAGESGGVLVDLEMGSRWPAVLHPSGQGWTINGCVAVSADAQSQIAADPGGFYVNLHNAEFPAGAVRAQLVPGVGEVIRFAELFPPAGFDPDVNGFANLALFSSQGLLCWDTPNSGIGEPTGMSIWDATGELVSFDLVTHPFLADTNFPGVDYTSFGCQAVDPATIDAIVANPNDFTFQIDSATAAPALTGVIFDPRVGPPQPPPPADVVELQILAINDFHGNIATTSSAFGGVGRADYLSTNMSTAEMEADNSIIVSAGDLIGASPLISALFHDEPTIEAMNLIGLEINGVGNHEFDEGPDELLRMANGGSHPVDGDLDGDGFAGADFEFLAANVVDDATGDTIFAPYTVKEYEGVEVAFIGMTLEGTPTIVTPEGVAGLTFNDEVETVNALIPEIQAMGIEAIVVLMHEGGVASEGGGDGDGCGTLSGNLYDIVVGLDDAVDLVIGGHNNQRFACTDVAGKAVTMAYHSGRMFTDIDTVLDKATGDMTVVSIDNKENFQEGVTPDADVTALIDRYDALSAPLANSVIGSITTDITEDETDAGESALGDVIADAQLAATMGATTGEAVVAFMNPGGIRADMLFDGIAGGEAAGEITFGEAFSVQPFGNSLVTMTLTGAQIHELLTQQWVGQGDRQRILQVSEGFSYTWDANAADEDKVDASSIMINGVMVDPAGEYRITVNSFLADGGDNFSVLTEGTDRLGGEVDLDALVTYFGANSPIAPGPQNRITRVEGQTLVDSVVKAPIVSDGNVAGAVTDFVVNLDTSLDPSVDGRSLKAGDTIKITLPDDFIDNGFATGAPGSATCMPGPCNLGVLLQGWPQHPIAPPAANYSLEREGTHTFVYTALQDLGPAGPDNPGIKQMHLILLGFTNPAAGDYDIMVEAMTGPDGAVEMGTGTLTILPEIAPSINVTSVFNEGTPNTIYQEAIVGEAPLLAYDFLLFDATGGGMVGVTLEDGVLMRDGARVGDVTITAPAGATGQTVTVATPSVAIDGPVLSMPTARLTAVFTVGSEVGDYVATFSLDGGNSVSMFVTAATESEPLPMNVLLTAALNGPNEVPGPGDPNGSGFAEMTINGTTLSWDISVMLIGDITGGHVHEGDASMGGPVFIDLDIGDVVFVDDGTGTYSATGSLTITEDQARAVAGNPGGFYLNLHTPQFPAGAIRGQLVEPG